MRPWRRWLEPAQSPVERFWVTADDGTKLSVQRVCQDGGAGAVMLLHGLAGSSTTFHFPGRSLAEYLAAQGFDCYVPELRGGGDSDAPARGWDLFDYLEHDLPALLGAIQRESGHERVHWIGHSMGGVLLFCFGITNPKAPVGRGISIGSALDYSRGPSGFKNLLFLRQLVRLFPRIIPYGAFTHLIAPLLGHVPTPLERFNLHSSNVEPPIIRRIHASAFGPIPTRLLLSLATTFDDGGLVDRDGSLRFVERAAGFSWPLLLVGGSADRQCPPEAVLATADLMTRAEQRRVQLFGKRHGHSDEYGHWDLLLGKRAPEEVWPVLSEWLSS